QSTYAQTRPKLDQLLAGIPEMISSPKIRDMVVKLRRESNNLKEIEGRAFELVSSRGQGRGGRSFGRMAVHQEQDAI
ncbi:MAG: hypothetical protein R6V55_15425, partial [Desulfovermiculus sp.]